DAVVAALAVDLVIARSGDDDVGRLRAMDALGVGDDRGVLAETGLGRCRGGTECEQGECAHAEQKSQAAHVLEIPPVIDWRRETVPCGAAYRPDPKGPFRPLQPE